MGYSKIQIKNIIEELLEIFGLEDKMDTEAHFSFPWYVAKAFLCLCFYKEYRKSSLDEPTLGLDC